MGPAATTTRHGARSPSPTPRTCSTRCPTGSTPRSTSAAAAFSGGQRQRLRAGPGAARRPRGAGAGRADQRGRRAHRGPDRRAAARRRARAGRTVVMTASPLLLDRADQVAFVDDGRVVADGHPPRAARTHPATARPSPGGRTHERSCCRSPTRRRAAARTRAAARRAGTAARLLAASSALHAARRGRRAGRARALLGELVQSVHGRHDDAHVDRVALAARRLPGRRRRSLTWFARRASFVLGEQVLAELREDFVRRVLALPLSTVERAGTGDLVTRTTARRRRARAHGALRRARDADRAS